MTHRNEELNRTICSRAFLQSTKSHV